MKMLRRRFMHPKIAFQGFLQQMGIIDFLPAGEDIKPARDGHRFRGGLVEHLLSICISLSVEVCESSRSVTLNIVVVVEFGTGEVGIRTEICTA